MRLASDDPTVPARSAPRNDDMLAYAQERYSTWASRPTTFRRPGWRRPPTTTAPAYYRGRADVIVRWSDTLHRHVRRHTVLVPNRAYRVRASGGAGGGQVWGHVIGGDDAWMGAQTRDGPVHLPGRS
jgi:hypothetical protein